jgi:hypothetical protein
MEKRCEKLFHLQKFPFVFAPLVASEMFIVNDGDDVEISSLLFAVMMKS